MTPQQKRELATELRKAGQTYKEIADQTGYSVDWCKRNLNTVDKNSNEKQAIKEAIKIAKSDNGITGWQIEKLVRDVYAQQEGQTEKEYDGVVQKAKGRFKAAINKEQGTVIRPYWMKPQQGVESLQLLMSSINSVQQSVDDAVMYMRKQLDLNDSHTKSIRFAIIKLLLDSGLVPEGAENHCSRLEQIAYKLDNPNDRVTHKRTLSHAVEHYTEKCAPKKPSVEKCKSVQLHPDDYEEINIDHMMEAMNEPY